MTDSSRRLSRLITTRNTTSILTIAAVAAVLGAVAYYTLFGERANSESLQDVMPLSQMHQDMLMPLDKCLKKGRNSEDCVQETVDRLAKDPNRYFAAKILTDGKVILTGKQVDALLFKD